jgi:hypothetical protein
MSNGFYKASGELSRESAFNKWGKHPDAFFTLARCETVGWKK